MFLLILIKTILCVNLFNYFDTRYTSQTNNLITLQELKDTK